ncbi:Phosphatidylinositol 3-kinase vps34 [Neolecta irregularis DAH-3]|uniref:Phosphatidylinositol 3-kinase VPS34 n=1 Tax=Neolecta irregularis (strain DAH-3) TaxID=1198029 RepID=A0A1U7LVD6_NEOID|nr:Phosphatidylinositol 3-kinase vps34 [Neolecta irregularis DAH-3]|eukprot:OLL26589.1 Phosphatidylinositol 3-kinase vps34 [Neolecta irregularis DAH-3]
MSSTLKTGKQKLKLWLGVQGDGSLESKTPGDLYDTTDEMDRLEKLMKQHEAGEIPKIDWLDNLAFRQIEKIHKLHAKDSEEHFLYIDFPRFNFPVVLSEREYSRVSTPIQPSLSTQRLSKPLDNVPLVTVYDPEATRTNPVESKHRRLVRSHRNGPVDRELKPNAKMRDELNVILNFSPTQELTSEEKDLIWKFRYYLTRDKRSLTKFLKAVDWADHTEVKQAIDLLSKWTEIDVDDALELLGPTFTNPTVRAYAVIRLQKADDDELTLYLLQLVQALRFEHIDDRKTEDTTDSTLANFLVTRAIDNEVLGNNLHWYLMVECENKLEGKPFAKVAYTFMKLLMETPDGLRRRNIFKRQAEIVSALGSISRQLQQSKEPRPKKIERLRKFLSEASNNLLQFEPVPLFLDARVKIVGIEPGTLVQKSPSDCSIHHLSSKDGSSYPIIFKSGDDLRQDQLVIQIITLMDKLLRKENLDLKLTPYKTLATESKQGAAQFIESTPLAGLLAEHNGSVLAYLKAHNPGGDKSTFGIKPEVMDNYVKSCAGYCVITYLLGVGDRHLDNLLLSPDGHFFHIDFGFILGRDPKPFAPQMKLCKEMVEGMGGASSPYYLQFKSYCFTAFTTLRKSANLILNLFALMVDANIPDIKIEPDKAVLKVKEKFCLEESDEIAIQIFENLIENSVRAWFPVIVDRMHAITQYLKG